MKRWHTLTCPYYNNVNMKGDTKYRNERTSEMETKQMCYPHSSPNSRVRKSSSSSSSSPSPSSNSTTSNDVSSALASPKSSAVTASFNLENPDRSATIFFRFASGERRTSGGVLLPSPLTPPSDGVTLRRRFRVLLDEKSKLPFTSILDSHHDMRSSTDLITLFASSSSSDRFPSLFTSSSSSSSSLSFIAASTSSLIPFQSISPSSNDGRRTGS